MAALEKTHFSSTFLLVLIALPGAAEAVDAPQTPSSPQCTYRDSKYGAGAGVCVAPHFGQRCGENGVWGPFTSEGGFNTACAQGQKCVYHDVQYTSGATICVGPRFAQRCGDDGNWEEQNDSPTTTMQRFQSAALACANAQVPAFATSASSSTSTSSGK